MKPDLKKFIFISCILFIAALVVRCIALIQNQVIANDAIIYIKSAKLYSMGAYAEGFNTFPRSTFPLMIAFSQRLFGDWVRAGQWVSTFFGALAVIPLYLFARRIFNEKIAMVSAIFYIVCPSLVKDSAEVLRETPFIFFYTTALWLGYEGIREKRTGVMSLAGVFILFSASLKDYGLILFISLILFLCWYVAKRKINRKKALILCSTFLISVITVLVLFEMLSNHKKYDVYTPVVERATSILIGIIYQKPIISNLEDQIEESGISTQGKRLLGLAIDHRVSLYFFHIFSKTIHAFNILLFVFFIFGLVKRRIIPYHMDEFLLFAIYITYIPLFLLFLNIAVYFSTRHVFPLLIPSLIWSSVGFEEVKERITHWFQKRQFSIKEWWFQHIGLLLLVLTIIGMLSIAWAPHRKDKLGLKEIGLWLKNNGYANSIVLSENRFVRLAFYADSEFISPPKGTYEDIMKFARKQKVNLIVVDKGTADRLPSDFLDKISFKDLQSINIKGSKYNTMVFHMGDQK